MRIDLNFILSGEEYTPQVGAEYELAPGKWGKMAPPTVELQQRAIAAAKDGQPDTKLAKMVLLDLDDFGDDKFVVGMASVVVRDFFSLVERIVMLLMSSSEESPE